MNNYIGGEGRKVFDPASPEFAHARPKPMSDILAQIATTPEPERATYDRLRGLASTYELPSFADTFGVGYGSGRRRARIRQSLGHPEPVAIDIETYGIDLAGNRDRTTIAVLDSLGMISNFDFASIERRIMSMPRARERVQVDMHVVNNFGVQMQAAEVALGTFMEAIREAMPRIRDGLFRTMNNLFMYGTENPDEVRRFATGGLVPRLNDSDEVPAILNREQVFPRAILDSMRRPTTGRLSSSEPNRQWIVSTPRRESGSMFDRFSFPRGDETIRFLDTEASFDPDVWARTMNFGGFPEPEIPTRTFNVKGSEHNQAEIDLMAEILRERGVEIPYGITGLTSEHIRAAGMTRIVFEETFQIRRKILSSIPVRILRRARRTVAGIAVVEAENQFGERILAPAPTGS